MTTPLQKVKNMRREIKDIWSTIGQTTNKSDLAELKRDIEQNAMLLGGLHVERVKALKELNSIQDAEFKVFSQFGQDGIIQYLINNIEIPNKIFIEFGVEMYSEATTRFLLMNNRWSGLVMDGQKSYMDHLARRDMYWQYDLASKHAFITKENINQLIGDYTDVSDIGILVVDIDGNDYWVWKEINVIKPRIVVCEYNAIFGSKRSITVPYDPEFVNPDYMHFGASLRALTDLSNEKGYALVGCNSAGNDCFFVRKDLLKSPLKEVSVEEAFVKPGFKGAYENRKGNWHNTRPLFDLETNKVLEPKEFKRN